jgi:short-subunit dehydrogenase
MKLQQVCIVTGASKGIGLAIAQQLHDDGYLVFGTSRIVDEKSELPFTILPLEVRSDSSVNECVHYVWRETGRVDALINNAGYDLYGSAIGTSMEELTAQMDVNFFGAVRIARQVLPIMTQQKSGKIINISSIGGFLSLPFNSAYAASKFAMEGYFEAMRYEVRPFHIFVSLIEPQAVSTNTLNTSIQSIHDEVHEHQQQLMNMVQRMRDDGVKNGISPKKIVNVVSRILAEKEPSLRYPVGGLANFMPWMKTLMPQKSFEKFMAKRFLS